MTNRTLNRKEDTMIKGTIRLYLLLKALFTLGISFIAAVYVTFLITKGLNLLEVNLVNMVFYATLFLFEIPTGAFADVYGRKASFVVACLLFACGMFIYSASGSFWAFALAEGVSAIGATFASGAFQAWMVDKLHHHGFTGSLSKIFSKEQQIDSGVGIAGAIAGAYLADKMLSLPWIVGGTVMLGTALAAAMLMKEEYFVRQKFSWATGLASMKNTVRASIKYGVNDKTVRFILVLGTVQFLAVMAPNMQWQPFFLQFLPNKTSLGFIWTGMALCMMLGATLSPWFLRKIVSEKKALVLTQIAIGAGLLATAAARVFPVALTIFLAHEVARGAFRPLKDVYLHDNIPSRERATLVSFESISHHVGGFFGLLLSGLLAQHAGIRWAWVVSGMILIIGALALSKNGQKTPN